MGTCDQKSDMQQRVALVHEGKKTFKSESCEYSSVSQNDMKQRIASIHEGKKSFKCALFVYSCDLKIDMHQHIASVHEGQKPVKCNSCSYTCNQKSDLQRHVAFTHEGKKPFKCGSLNVLTFNVCGLKLYGRIDQVRNLLLHYKISIAVLIETDIFKIFNIEGFTVFCPPPFTTGPKGKEAGAVILVSNDIASPIIL